MRRAAHLAVRQPGFGDRLRTLRLEAGLRQQDLAGQQVSAAYVSMLERGHRTPSLDVVEYLADQLGCAPTNLRDDTRAGAPDDVELDAAAFNRACLDLLADALSRLAAGDGRGAQSSLLQAAAALTPHADQASAQVSTVA